MGRHRKPDELDDHATTPTSSVADGDGRRPLPEPEAVPRPRRRTDRGKMARTYLGVSRSS